MLCDLGALTGAVVVISMGEGPASWRVPEALGRGLVQSNNA